ncbi:hypothetical protein H5410_005520, partial [Solanum commersonii]
MVKVVVGEESQVKLAENWLSKSGVPCQVGLVIGNLSGKLDRGFIFDLVPTPLNDNGVPACSIIGGAKDDRKKASKGKSLPHSFALFIDKDWLAEHAPLYMNFVWKNIQMGIVDLRNISRPNYPVLSLATCQLTLTSDFVEKAIIVGRMLVGGVKGVGIMCGPMRAHSKIQPSLLVRRLSCSCKSDSLAAPLLEVDWDERLLVHIGYSPLRWTCRNCSLASNITSGNLRPCDFKMGKILSTRCPYTRVQVAKDWLTFFIMAFQFMPKSLKANEDEQFDLGGVHDVEFLLPFMEDKYLEVCSQKEITGLLVFSGSVCSYAYSNSKEPSSQALTNIK